MYGWIQFAGVLNAEADALAFTTFPREHRGEIHSTNPLERLNGEIKRRAEVVGIVPDEIAILRLMCTILIEPNGCLTTQPALTRSIAPRGRLVNRP